MKRITRHEARVADASEAINGGRPEAAGKDGARVADAVAHTPKTHPLVAPQELPPHQEMEEALEQAGVATAPERPVSTRHKAWLGVWVVLLVGFLALYQLLHESVLNVPARWQPMMQRLALGSAAIAAVLGAARGIEAFLIERLHRPSTRFNLRRVLSLASGLAIFFIVLSIVSATWYTAVVSLGVISLILGFALQTPITSFIAWVYILVRAPYRVGDRIRIGEARGDVIDVSYLDTTLWEFGGEYLSTDHPSGRIIKFPNSTVLTQAVYNYSWPLFPYIWNEVKFQVAYGSDLDWVAKTMEEVAESAIGPEMRAHIDTYRKVLAKTPVNALDVRERPSVFFRVHDNTWLEAIVRYLVDPRQAGRVKNRLVREMVTRLNASPDRVLFPSSNLR
jgi:small-conductance mechanosensitive channel